MSSTSSKPSAENETSSRTSINVCRSTSASPACCSRPNADGRPGRNERHLRSCMRLSTNSTTSTAASSIHHRCGTSRHAEGRRASNCGLINPSHAFSQRKPSSSYKNPATGRCASARLPQSQKLQRAAPPRRTAKLRDVGVDARSFGTSLIGYDTPSQIAVSITKQCRRCAFGCRASEGTNYSHLRQVLTSEC
jgi:hypothetical protein